MIPPNATYAQIGALVDELARCGMRHAVACPGSRNAPLALVLAGDDRFNTTPVIDERAAGFMALGMAKASGLPVAVTCTSGTAAANLLPAVVEAHEARVPLIVLTADRPPELRDVGAGQAIDQIGLYGSFAKWFVEVGSAPPGGGEPGRAWATHLRALACRAFWTAAGGRPGPVHLNLPLREPLAPVADGALDLADWAGRPDGAPWTRAQAQPPAAAAEEIAALAGRIAGAPWGAIVCGPTHEDLAAPVAALAAASGWPVLAEPCSGVRCGDHDIGNVVAHYDALLRSERFAGEHVPDMVLRLGDMPTSKPLRAWVAGAGEQVVIDPHLSWHEPTRSAGTVLQAAASSTAMALAEVLGGHPAPANGWTASWREADDRVPPLLAATPEPFEPLAYTAIASDLPDGALVWVGSSMAIRDVETFWPRLDGRVRLLSNRGANGIDGVVASAAGAALATGAPTWLLIGDVSLLHDLGGLLAAVAAGADLRIVCVNNGGGAIFDFLPVAEHAEPGAYERHIATPPQLDLAAVAALAGVRHTVTSHAAEIRAAAAQPGLIEIRTERGENVARHRELLEAIAAQI